jgi:hypothetical protein
MALGVHDPSAKIIPAAAAKPLREGQTAKPIVADTCILLLLLLLVTPGLLQPLPLPQRLLLLPPRLSKAAAGAAYGLPAGVIYGGLPTAGKTTAAPKLGPGNQEGCCRPHRHDVRRAKPPATAPPEQSAQYRLSTSRNVHTGIYDEEKGAESPERGCVVGWRDSIARCRPRNTLALSAINAWEAQSANTGKRALRDGRGGPAWHGRATPREKRPERASCRDVEM